jgi:tRNA uridine 5-carbamoylmethylation protein Kti12
MTKLKTINLCGGPGSGKSTIAAGLFHLMKLNKISVELVTEYAKYAVWREHQFVLGDQLYVFAKQNHRMFCLRDKVEWIITDSPLYLQLIYGNNCSQTFKNLVMEVYHSYDNYNFFVKRVKGYEQAGRNQTENEAKLIDNGVHTILSAMDEPYHIVDGDEDAAQKIFEKLFGTKLHGGKNESK